MSEIPQKPVIPIIDLPEGAYRPELTDPKPQRWPKILYQDLNKLFHKAGVSFPRAVISILSEWRDKNKHLL